ncbi:MAG TPA: nitrate reductase molybdenum cofactor assembly chaperone [Burkholderiaceae bacterium]|nr:nitrate reductase molybdenum cofactor assembly chaperone [Burkholderiaceae bacterium]
MSGTTTRTLRGLAALLAYPDEALARHAAEVIDAIRNERALPASDLDALATLASTIGGADCDLLDVQARYVDTFDRGRSSALYLFEHVHGSSRDRGQAMVDLNAMYARSGLGPLGRELPDFVPMYLEWLSSLPADAARDALRDVVHLLRPIGQSLTRRGSPYAAVFVALLRLAGERSPQKALAAADGLEQPDDATPQALDAAWVDEPVGFLGACAPSAPREHVVSIHRGGQR